MLLLLLSRHSGIFLSLLSQKFCACLVVLAGCDLLALLSRGAQVSACGSGLHSLHMNGKKFKYHNLSSTL